MPSTFNVTTSGGQLCCTDSGGAGQTVVFLNGAFGTRRDWRRVLASLGGRYRCVTFDARGRGKSSGSPSYSFAADVDDVAVVLSHMGSDRPILVGWSLGAALAVRYASQHAEEVSGLVLIDGAFPVAQPTEAEKEYTHRMFRRMALPMRIMAAVGRSTQMSAAQAADLNIDLRMALPTLEDDYDCIGCPVDFVIGSKRHMGATEEACRTMRLTVGPLVNAHPNVSLFATLPVSHTQILAKHPDTVAASIDDVATRAGAQRQPPLL